MSVRWLVIGLFALALEAQDLTDRIRAAQSAGKYSEAAQLYSQLIAAGTDSPEVRSNYGVMLHLAGRNDEAIRQFRIALGRNTSLAAANLFAGLTEVDLGEPRQAIPYLKRARDSDGRQPAPFLALGAAYVSLRDYASANENYANATILDPNLAEAWYGLGVTDRSLAEQLLNRAARNRENTGADRAKAAELLTGALQALTRALELDPNSARTHLVMAESLSNSGKLTEAAAEYQNALKLDPRLEAASLGLASQYWKQRQFDQALPPLKEVLRKSPKDPEANGMMADILQHAGQNAEAKRYADLALAGNPDLIETRVVLARVYLAAQQPKAAVSELQKVLPADPDGSYHFLLYRAYRQAGDEQSAKSALVKFEQIRKSSAQR